MLQSKGEDPNGYICCLQETHIRTQYTHRLKVKGWKKTFHVNRKEKTKDVMRDKEEYFIKIKG